jgi:hypothetical protein
MNHPQTITRRFAIRDLVDAHSELNPDFTRDEIGTFASRLMDDPTYDAVTDTIEMTLVEVRS